jgi:exopolysaccharide biosynthesis polyprenyl glycosylphosphotransferase
LSVSPAILDQVNEQTLKILERRRGPSSGKRRGWLVRRALLAADLLGLIMAFTVAETIYGAGSGHGNHFAELPEELLFVAWLPVWVVAAKVYGLYDRDEERTDHTTADDFAGVFQLLTVMSWLLLLASRVTPFAHPQIGKLIVFWFVAVACVPAARAASRAYCRRQIHYLQNTVIVGAGDVGQSLAMKLLIHPEYGLNLVGFIDSSPKEQQPGLEHLVILGDTDDLPEIVDLLDVERVIFAFSGDGHDTTLEAIRLLNDLNIQVDLVPRLFEVVGPGVDVHSVEGVPVISLPPLRLSRSSHLMKRTLDVVGATLLSLVLSPLLIAVAVLIKLDSRGEVFFRQERVGAEGEGFRIWKFRTMRMDAEDIKDDLRHLNVHARPGGDPRMFKVENDPRVTGLGKFLRRLSLDELPQLVNVLTGDMSLVGPRPLILEEDQYVESWGRRRLDLKPGMTGLWQVLGRSDIPFGEMLRLDYVYVTNWSLGGDLRLLLRTLPVVLFGRRNRVKEW